MPGSTDGGGGGGGGGGSDSKTAIIAAVAGGACAIIVALLFIAYLTFRRRKAAQNGKVDNGSGMLPKTPPPDRKEVSRQLDRFGNVTTMADTLPGGPIKPQHPGALAPPPGVGMQPPMHNMQPEQKQQKQQKQQQQQQQQQQMPMQQQPGVPMPAHQYGPGSMHPQYQGHAMQQPAPQYQARQVWPVPEHAPQMQGAGAGFMPQSGGGGAPLPVNTQSDVSSAAGGPSHLAPPSAASALGGGSSYGSGFDSFMMPPPPPASNNANALQQPHLQPTPGAGGPSAMSAVSQGSSMARAPGHGMQRANVTSESERNLSIVSFGSHNMTATSDVNSVHGPLVALEHALDNLAEQNPPGTFKGRYSVLRERTDGGQALVQFVNDVQRFCQYAVKCASACTHRCRPILSGSLVSVPGVSSTCCAEAT